MAFTLYNVVSADGFIADEHGNEDFIPDSLWEEFIALCREKGALVLGRRTYDAIRGYEESLRKELDELPIRKIVLSRDTDFVPLEGYIVAHSIEEAAMLAPNALVSSGPNLNDQLREKGLVGEVLLKKLPVTIGKGIRPFDS